jgi:hypothetical protein
MRRKNYSIKKTHRALFQIGSTIKNLARDGCFSFGSDEYKKIFECYETLSAIQRKFWWDNRQVIEAKDE